MVRRETAPHPRTEISRILGRTYGDFLLAGPISEAFTLGAVSLRLGGKRLRWDAEAMKVTNLPEANRYLVREYRKGWELTA